MPPISCLLRPPVSHAPTAAPTPCPPHLLIPHASTPSSWPSVPLAPMAASNPRPAAVSTPFSCQIGTIVPHAPSARTPCRHVLFVQSAACLSSQVFTSNQETCMKVTPAQIGTIVPQSPLAARTPRPLGCLYPVSPCPVCPAGGAVVVAGVHR